jgi:CheY-like chemotaxis protein
MCKKLEKLQFVCDEARDGQEAMRILNQRREDGDSDFDMILVDFKMPKMDGLELVTKLQEANFHLPVVLISGSLSLAELQLAAKNYPLFASISKPVESAELQLLAEKIAQKSLQKKAA